MKIRDKSFVALVLSFIILISAIPGYSVKAEGSNVIDFSPYVSNQHPRLYVNDFSNLKQEYLSDPLTARWYNNLMSEVQTISDGSVVEYDIDAINSSGDNKTRIIPSQAILGRFYCLAFAAACEDSQALANRLWLEIDAAINLSNWHPSHWLETAEMMHSVAIAYDWCYKFWTQQQKDLMEEAIINLGLSQAIREYAGKPRWYEWVYGMDGLATGTNWTVVCNAGVLIASLALYGEYGGYEEYFKTTSSDTHNSYIARYKGKESEFCNVMINNAVRSMKVGLNAYSSDGSYRENFAYWDYATENLIMAIDSFENAIGGNFNSLPPIEVPFTYDFSLAPGISITPDFPMYANGPDGIFAYGDSNSTSKMSAPAFMWIGNRFNTPHYTEYHLTNKGNATLTGVDIPLSLLWYEGGQGHKEYPAERLFENDFASMRSSWNDDDALFVAFKGGKNGRPHQHYDVGTFILDAFDTRFVKTPGAIQYYGSGRTKVYKGRTEGQNTVVINPDESCGQYQDGTSVFEDFYSGNESAYAILDMTDVYDKKGSEDAYEKTTVTSARRGVKMFSNKSRVIVQDEFKMNAPSEYYWFMHTSAKISLYNNDKSAILNRNGNLVYVNLLSDVADAKFVVMDPYPLDTSPIPTDQTFPGGKKLAVHLENVTDVTMAVEFVPVANGTTSFKKEITALDSWHPESDVERDGRNVKVFGVGTPGTTVTMISRSPLGDIVGMDQKKIDASGEYIFNITLPEEYKNGIYSVFINGKLYQVFDVSDGVDTDQIPVSYSVGCESPSGSEGFVIIAAEYNDNTLVQLSEGIHSNFTMTSTAVFGKAPQKGSTVKFLFLEDLESLTPIHPVNEIVI